MDVTIGGLLASSSWVPPPRVRGGGSACRYEHSQYTSPPPQDEQLTNAVPWLAQYVLHS
jgi:hypothetical protein